ncbi:MAG: WecB/TagA/CpsF family glycosyltransferase [Planctomycetota bacterium]
MSTTEADVVIPGPLGQPPRPARSATVRRLFRASSIVRSVLHRVFDVVLASLMTLLALPILIVRGAVAYATTGSVFERESQLGMFRSTFDRLRFAGRGFGKNTAVLFNILRGEMSFVGPRPLSPAETSCLSAAAFARFLVRPGLVSPYSIRKRSRIAYENEFDTDSEFVYSENIKSNLGLLARSIPSSVIGSAESLDAPPIFDIFGVSIVNTTMDSAVQWITQRARSDKQSQVCFVNPDSLNIAYKHKRYTEVLQASRVFPDGIGINVACRLLGTSLVANVNGTDMFPRLCKVAAEERVPIFLLGARPGIAQAAADAMSEKYPDLVVAGTRHGYFNADEEGGVIDEINRSGAKILFIAFGNPRQEIWFAENSERLAPRVGIGVGGLFDFYSGRIPRAPMWMREIGLEWTWRLLQEPRRMWRRYVVGNPLFVFRVWKQAKGASSP